MTYRDDAPLAGLGDGRGCGARAASALSARCALCWNSGRVITHRGPSQPCPRCEPEECAAGVPCCRLCGGVMFTIPGQRANLGWLCGRCSPRSRRPHADLLAGAVRLAPVDWTKPVDGWVLFT